MSGKLADIDVSARHVADMLPTFPTKIHEEYCLVFVGVVWVWDFGDWSSICLMPLCIVFGANPESCYEVVDFLEVVHVHCFEDFCSYSIYSRGFAIPVTVIVNSSQVVGLSSSR